MSIGTYPSHRGPWPWLPSQEASGSDRSAPLGVRWTVIRFRFCEGLQWFIAGWSSPVARQAHNLKVIGSNPIHATKFEALENVMFSRAFCCPDFGLKFRSWKRRGSGRRKVAAENWRSCVRLDDSIVIGSAQHSSLPGRGAARAPGGWGEMPVVEARQESTERSASASYC